MMPREPEYVMRTTVHFAVVAEGQWSPACLPDARWAYPLARDTTEVTCDPCCARIVQLRAEGWFGDEEGLPDE